MVRKRKTSLAEDLLDLAAMLPWWAGMSSAIVSYLLLHSLASLSPTSGLQPGQLGQYVGGMLWKAFAYYGQFFIPLIFLGGAAISAWRQRQRNTLIADVAQSNAANALDGISWREFEMLVGEAFRLQGYQVVETGDNGADGGIDLILSKGGEKFFVQCKQWKAFKVGVEVVRELYGVMAAKGAAGGFAVTSGRFTDAATSFANGRNLQLIDGPALLRLIARVKTERGEMTNAAIAKNTNILAEANAATPPCPVCSKTMVRRSAKRGANAGSQFWGCSGYPACKGTRPI